MYRRSRSYVFKRLDLRLCKSHMRFLQTATKAEPNASQEHIAQTPLVYPVQKTDKDLFGSDTTAF